ncbi:MAG: hypothetical protein F8N15_08100 [Methanobacterium sp.]|nr:hypothetical protein [Methanobacterium sp.]
MDQKGFIFSLDVFLSLLIMMLILGISADAMDIAGNRIDDFYSEQTYQRITDDACDVLIKTSGSPEYWDEMGSVRGVSPGLADTKNSSGTNRLSSKKLEALKNNPELMDKLIPEGFKCSVTIYPYDSSLPLLYIVNQTNNISTEVYVANRTIMYSYNSYVICTLLTIQKSLDTNKSHYNCPHSQIKKDTHDLPDFSNKRPGWYCDAFKIGKDTLNSTDFYLLTDPPHTPDQKAMWILDTPNNLSATTERFQDCPIDITSRVRELGKEDVLVIHIYASGDLNEPFKVYIMGVPSGTPVNNVKINYLGLKAGYIVLKIWN